MRLEWKACVGAGVIWFGLCGSSALCAGECALSPDGLIGGAAVGSCDYLGVSVVTISTSPGNYDAKRFELVQIFRGAHPERDFPTDFLVAIPIDRQVHNVLLDSGGVYDPDQKLAVLVDLTSLDFAPGNGFTPTTLHNAFHEMSHHFVTTAMTPPIRPNLLRSHTTAGASGVLNDDSVSFCALGVVPYDRVRLIPGGLFDVQSVGDHALVLNTTQTIPSGRDYQVRKALTDVQGHWLWNVFVGGSHLKATEPVFEGECPESVCSGATCRFTSPDAPDRFSPLELFLMGLLTFPELEQSPRPYKVEQVAGESGVPVLFEDMRLFFDGLGHLEYDPRDGVIEFPTRLILATTVGRPVSAASAAAVDQVRRDMLLRFHRETSRRGVLRTNLEPARTDPVLGQVVVPPIVGANEVFETTVFVQNQSGVPSAPFDLKLSVGALNLCPVQPPGVRPQCKLLSFPGLSENELREIRLPLVLPDVFGPGTTPPYQGSIPLRVALQTSGDVHAGESNVRVVHIGSSVGEASPPGSEPIVAGPVTARDLVFVARTGATEDSIEILNLADPFHPRTIGRFGVGARIADLEGDPDQLFVATGSRVAFHDVPLASGFAPRFTLDLSGRFPIDMAPLGDFLYVTATDLSSSRTVLLLVSGVGNPETATVELLDPDVDPDLPGPDPLRVRTFGNRLYVLGPRLIVYDVTDRDDPVRLASVNFGDSISDLWVTSGGGVTIAMNGGVHAVSADLTQVVDSWEPGAGPGATALRGGKNFLIAGGSGRWVVLAATPSRLEVVGELFVGKVYGIAAMGEIAGWTLLADADGVRAFSPTGVNRKFVRGDTTGDGIVSFTDIAPLAQLLSGGPYPVGGEDAFDVDDSGTITIADLTKLTAYVLERGSRPPAPFPAAGVDTTADSLVFLKSK